ncbi:hypothetical protein MCOR02_001436 [Pyricularia oryzae]|uniref:Uncharacterized protein n=1 Tax=Pyricularia oryzae TaxID=318829 RepID=A0A4P7N5X2_PYROR|nr:hypothetical protein MCOR02_001436 [Pyricularia oryzae]KAI6510140.1 hypothetical protein MCOR13_001206 [Pyricularia oryzae]QBZ55380.1 hypothetical protein PoMZ_00277 [Pyricularia oryzae]
MDLEPRSICLCLAVSQVCGVHEEGGPHKAFHPTHPSQVTKANYIQSEELGCLCARNSLPKDYRLSSLANESLKFGTVNVIETIYHHMFLGHQGLGLVCSSVSMGTLTIRKG